MMLIEPVTAVEVKPVMVYRKKAIPKPIISSSLGSRKKRVPNMIGSARKSNTAKPSTRTPRIIVNHPAIINMPTKTACFTFQDA
jgi:hypothetical protein